MSSRTAVDDAYDNAMHFADVPQWRERWQQRSAAYEAATGDRFDLAYGSSAAQRLDILPCATPERSATAIFLHGGFWSRNSKLTFRFLARGFHAARLNVAFVGYTLAPEARMDAIVGDAVAATRWLAPRLASLGLAPRPLLAVGWSAGAHLAAMLTSEPSVGGGMGISGVYDLRPLRDSAMNNTLQLDASNADLYSPQLHVEPDAAPFVIAFGGRELEAYRQQSTAFHHALRSGGAESELHELAGHHHHSVLEELFKPEGRLVSRLDGLASSAARQDRGRLTSGAIQ